jgi:hypothetical protein
MISRSPDQLWREIGSHPDLLATRDEWALLLGDDFELCSRLLVATRELTTAWACGLPGAAGCFRQVVQHAPDRIVAVCTEGRCDKVQVERPRLILHRLDLARLARRICGAVGMGTKDVATFENDGASGRQPTTLRLGALPFGAENVPFYFVRDSGPDRLLPFFDKVRLRDPTGHVVVFVPRDNDVALVAREAARRKGLDVLALDRVASVGGDGRLLVDLADFVIKHHAAELDPSAFLWPRYWLVLDPRARRYWYAGQPIDFPTRSRLPQALLMALAERPGENVVRNDLCPVMWPDEYGGKKTLEVDWDRRIRDQKSALIGLLAAAAAEADGLPADPVRAVAGSDVAGGYVLGIPASRVFWWSQPTA